MTKSPSSRSWLRRFLGVPSCPLLNQAYQRDRKSAAGSKRIDPLVLFKLLIFQQLFNLSDSELEFQVNDRRSFEQFIGVDVMDSIPDATTVAFFRERLRKADLIEEIFEHFEQHLRDEGYEARGGQIIDATIVPVPSREIHAQSIRISRMARFTRAGRKAQNGYSRGMLTLDGPRNTGSITTDTTMASLLMLNTESSEDIMWYVVPASVHNSQLLPALLDLDNQADVVWADSAFASKKFDELLDLAGFENNIHEKGSRNYPLAEAAKERNNIRSTIRVKVEHVFGGMVTWMRGKLTIRIGCPRTKAWWGLRNLTFNLI